MIVFDTNILSTFAKINKLKLLADLFYKQPLLIPESVVEELKQSKQEYSTIILNDKNFQQIKLNEEENTFLTKLREMLGKGEAECISICKNRNYIFITNDARALKEAEKQNIECLSLQIILKALKEFKILNKEELESLIKEIETKDKVKILNKKDIL